MRSEDKYNSVLKTHKELSILFIYLFIHSFIHSLYIYYCLIYVLLYLLKFGMVGGIVSSFRIVTWAIYKYATQQTKAFTMFTQHK